MEHPKELAEEEFASAPLDPDTGVALYRQIYTILKSRILTGELVPGDRLMTEAQVCAAFAVSRITARRALNELAASGLVIRTRRRGTEVAEGATRPQPLSGSLQGLFDSVGRIGRSTTVRTIARKSLPASAEVADVLRVPEGTPVHWTVRVRASGVGPISYLVAVLPMEVADRLSSEKDTTPLLLQLEQAGVEVVSARQTISATVADAEVAAALQIPAGHPLIDLRRRVFDAHSRVVEYIRVLYRPEHFQFEIDMQRIEDGGVRRWSTETMATPAGPYAAGR